MQQLLSRHNSSYDEHDYERPLDHATAALRIPCGAVVSALRLPRAAASHPDLAQGSVTLPSVIVCLLVVTPPRQKSCYGGSGRAADYCTLPSCCLAVAVTVSWTAGPVRPSSCATRALCAAMALLQRAASFLGRATRRSLELGLVLGQSQNISSSLWPALAAGLLQGARRGNCVKPKNTAGCRTRPRALRCGVGAFLFSSSIFINNKLFVLRRTTYK